MKTPIIERVGLIIGLTLALAAAAGVLSALIWVIVAVWRAILGS